MSVTSKEDQICKVLIEALKSPSKVLHDNNWFTFNYKNCTVKQQHGSHEIRIDGQAIYPSPKIKQNLYTAMKDANINHKEKVRLSVIDKIYNMWVNEDMTNG